MATPLYDVLIIGGGPAGLSAATGIARQRFTAVVLDAGKPRIDAASHMHNVVTWDHEPPAAFRAKARRDLTVRYEAITFVDSVEVTQVERVEREGGAVEFVASADDGQRTWRGRKLLLATGSRDLLPEIDGLRELYGKLVFPCLSCHGYELRGSPTAGVLAVGNTATVAYASHFARMIMPLVEGVDGGSGKVTVYTSDPAGSEFTTTLRGVLEGSTVVEVEARKVVGLAERGGKVLVRLEEEAGNVEEREEAFLAHLPKTAINGPFAEQLGLEMQGDGGEIKVNWPFNETSVKGVFAVGDCANVLKAVIQAVCMGGFAASGITAQLGQENLMATKVKKADG